jgi:hypothetical protein
VQVVLQPVALQPGERRFQLLGRHGGAALVAEEALRARVAAMVTAQAVEDEAELRVTPGAPLPHRYNAAVSPSFASGRARATEGPGRSMA